MILFHAGFAVIKEPDIHYGRKNADFGQGFYLTENEEFAHRWAGERNGETTFVNSYELDTVGLKIHRFLRDKDWFEYIYSNRNNKNDFLTADVVIGPIANDVIYNTFGITTSGFLSAEDAMKLLLAGPEYHQVAIKSEKAVSQLKWLGAVKLTSEEIQGYRALVAEEEKEYQRLISEILEDIS